MCCSSHTCVCVATFYVMCNTVKLESEPMFIASKRFIAHTFFFIAFGSVEWEDISFEITH